MGLTDLANLLILQILLILLIHQKIPFLWLRAPVLNRLMDGFSFTRYTYSSTVPKRFRENFYPHARNPCSFGAEKRGDCSHFTHRQGNKNALFFGCLRSMNNRPFFIYRHDFLAECWKTSLSLRRNEPIGQYCWFSSFL